MVQFDTDRPNRTLRGAFCTGHTPMVGSEEIFFSEAAKKEFIEEYKNVHGLRKPSGPGRVVPPDWTAARKPPLPVPVTGAETARTIPGGRPPRNATTSNEAYGSFWNDPLLSQKTQKTQVPLPGPTGIGQTTNSTIGEWWHQRDIFPKPLEPVYAHNRSSKFEDEQLSQFALEDLPTMHRML